MRRAAIKKAASKTLIAGGVIGLGVFGGLLPAALSNLAKSVGGAGLVRELGEALSAIERNPAQKRITIVLLAQAIPRIRALTELRILPLSSRI